VNIGVRDCKRFQCGIIKSSAKHVNDVAMIQPSSSGRDGLMTRARATGR
jgi:hypothetical protein